MIKSLRIYRFFRALLAMLLLFSISLPMVRYACAMTGLTVMTSPTSSSVCAVHEGAMQDASTCQTPASTLCPEDGPCPMAEQCRNEAAANDAVSCCKAEAVQSEKAPFTESKLALSQIVLPLVAVLTNPEATSSPRLSFPSQETSRAKGGGVPLRVLFSSFVI